MEFVIILDSLLNLVKDKLIFFLKVWLKKYFLNEKAAKKDLRI